MEKKQNMTFRLDDSVVIAFLVACVIASMAFVVRYTNYTPCKEFSIKTLTDKIFTASLTRMEADITTGKKYEWDFGDNQDAVTEVNSVVHSYDRPGEYLITLTVDGRCVQQKTIFVQQAAEIVDSSQVPRAIIPHLAEVGKPVSFIDTTQNARTWEWRFGENENVDAYVKNPTYTFRQPGTKTITLTINGNNKNVLVRKIFVSPPQTQQLPVQPIPQRQSAPRRPINQMPETNPLDDQLNPKPQPQTPAAPPPIVKAPDISIGEFKQMLYGVADKKLNAGSFAKYFCDGNLNTYTNINGKAETFNQLCAKLASLKKSNDIKSMTVTPTKNPQTNCITSVQIIVKVKKGIFGLSTSHL